MRMAKHLKGLLTGKDNETPDIARVLGFIGGVAFVMYAGFEVINTAHFAAQDYGIGFGALLGGTGVGIGAKANTEPEPSPKAAEDCDPS